MKDKIAQIIYENQYGCTHEEAIEHLGFTIEQYPEWDKYSNKKEYIQYAQDILNNPKFKTSKEKMAKRLFELMEPNSKYIWSFNNPDDRVIITGNVLYEYCLSQWQQDDYLNIAYHIMKIIN